MKFKYVSPKAVERVVGRYAPVNSFILARIIEEALDNTNQGYVHTEAGVGRLRSDPPEISEALVGISDRLLAHNLAISNRPSWEFYSGLDFDLVHESTGMEKGLGRSVNTTVKAYFYHTQFSRPPQDQRVVFHLIHNELMKKGDATLYHPSNVHVQMRSTYIRCNKKDAFPIS